MNPSLSGWTRFWTAALLLVCFPAAGLAQAAGPLPMEQQPAQGAPQAPDAADGAKPVRQPRGSDRRRAVKLYFASSKQFAAGQFEEAMRGFEQAATLDPTNADYRLAADVARSHAVTALIQDAAKDRIRGDAAGARAALAHALELDPRNIAVTQHLYELGDDALLGLTKPLYEQAASTAGEAAVLAPSAGVHSFHLHTDQRQAILQVFKAYGLEVTLDESVHSALIRLDMDDASFQQATRTLGLLTNTFYVSLDAHRALVARNTRENRQQFTRQELETIYLSGLTATELTDVSNLAKNVFDAQQAVTEPSAGTITLRAPASTLNAFNATMRGLLDGRSQVLLDVRLIQLAHTSTRNTGVQPPQSISAYNVYAEEQSILSANSSAVQEIISSGLASATDTLAILAILIAAGDVSSSLFSNGFATFGGGITESALSPGKVTTNLSLNSSDSRELDHMQLRLGDGEEGTLRMGSRYPIQTSSYSNMSSSSSTTAGLNSTGNSSSLSALLAQYSSSSYNVPQIEYQDLGLTLKATPGVMRNGSVALSLDMKITALSGSSINGNPILNSRAYSGVVELKQAEGVVVVSELDKQQSRAISGTPGISEIPGLNNISGNDTQKDTSSLLIVITPHVIRGTQAAGHSPMMRIERSATMR